MTEFHVLKKSRKQRVGFISGLLLACLLISLLAQLIFSLASILSQYACNFALFINTYVLFFLIIGYIFSRGITKHFLIFSFFACFFILLMGQKFVLVLNGGEYNLFRTFKGLHLEGAKYLTFINLMYFSLFGIVFGYFGFKRKRHTPHKKVNISKEKVLLSHMRVFLSILLCITFICALIMQIQILKAKSDMSYVTSFLVNVEINPIIKLGNYFFKASAFLYLACKPSKKAMLAVLFSYAFVDGVLQLFIGQRMMFAQTALFAVWFCICYFKVDNKRFRFKHFLQLCLFGILLIVLFGMIEIIRSGNEADSFSLTEFFEHFFVSMGGSDSTIANTIEYQDMFPKEGFVYFFYPLKEALTNNIFARFLFGAKAVSGGAQSIEFLMNNDSFAHWLSYIVNSERYLSGAGMGSSFIAETYFAFGTVGVMVISVIIGILIRYLSGFDCDGKRIYHKAINMFFVYCVFIWPRSSLFSAATEFLYFILALLIIRIATEILGIGVCTASVRRVRSKNILN